MAVVNGYCTVQQVRDELGDTGASLDATLIEKAIGAASRAIDSWCGRRFWADETPVARYYRPVDPLTVIVDDISTATGLEVATDDGTGSYGTVWASGDVLLDPPGGDVDGAFAWTRLAAVGTLTFPTVWAARPPLRVTAAWGWSQVPDRVVEATVLRAVALFKRKEAVYGVADFGEFGPVRITRRDSDVADMLSGLIRYSSPET